MPTRMTALFTLTTTPVNRGTANPHTGGWSESWWTTQSGPARDASFVQLLTLRARLLPGSATIIGSRRAEFTIAGNRLFPGPTHSAENFYPGNAAFATDLPQASLQLKGDAATGPNRNSWYLRGIPDEFIDGGEFAPSRAFTTALTAFMNFLKTGLWGFVGRDLLQPRVRVLSLAGGILQTDGAIPGAAQGSFIRFSRVYDTNGNPIIGTFVTTNVAVNLYTMLGLTGRTVLDPSGTARLDTLSYSAYSNVNFNRAGTRRVGRPSEGYRGRRSR